MKIHLHIDSRSNRLRQTISLAAELVSLIMLLLFLSACVPPVIDSSSSIASPSHTTTNLSAEPPDPISKPIINPGAALASRTPPVIIPTSTPVENQMTPQANPSPNPLYYAQNKLLAYAKEDLAQRLGIPLEQIKLVSMEEVTWRDGSLGCPQPGMMYTQALVTGTLIILSVDDNHYRYHSGKGGIPFLCEHKPQSPLPPSNFGDD